MAKQFFKDLPDTTTPLTASRLNGLLDGEEPMGQLVVDSIRSKNMFSFNYEVTDTAVTHIVTNNTIIQTNAGAYARSSWKIPNLTIGTTYNFSCNYTNSNSCSIRLSIFNSTNTTLITETSATTSTSGNFSLTFTATETSIYIRFGTNTTSSGNTNSVTFSNIQLEEGSTATNYAPYQELNPDNFKNEEIVVGKIRSKNLINKNKSIRNIGTFHSALSTGVRVTLNVSAQYMWSTFELPSNLLGKIITISSTITPSASNNGKAALFFGNSSNDPVGQAIASLDQTGSVTTTIPTSFPSGTNKIILLLYGNVNGTGVTNNYVDYTNLQVEEGSQATNYMPYQDFDDKEIYLTEETVIGTFLGKPLYRKVIEFTVSDTTQMTIPHGISNLSWVTKCDTSIYNQYGFYMASSKDLTDVNFDINYIYFTSGWPTGNAKIIMEYTKN